jgi:hypothetical protein
MLRNDLDKGVELSGALARHPKYFTEYYVAMVRLGEGTGRLDEAFARLFQQLEFEKHMKQKIKGALRYPTFVLLPSPSPSRSSASGSSRSLERSSGDEGSIFRHDTVLLGVSDSR